MSTADFSPQQAEIMFAGAVKYHQQGNVVAAEAAYRQLLAAAPTHPFAHNNLGILLQTQGRLDDAVSNYQTALRIKPDYPDACNNLGSALQALGRIDEAVDAYREAVRLNPNYPDAFANLGNGLQAQRCLHQAIAAYRESLRLRPNHPPAYVSLANVMHELGRLDEAVAANRQALALRPNYPGALINLGIVLQQQGNFAEAIGSFRAALQWQPGLPKAHYNLGNALKESGLLDQALAAYDEALRLNPSYGQAAAQAVNLMQYLCLWDGLDARIAALRDAVVMESPLASGIPPFVFLALDASAAHQQCCARQWALNQHFLPVVDALRSPTRKNPTRPLRIGYLSSDFRQHALAISMAEIFESHDRHAVEIIGYSHGVDDGGALRQRLIQAFDRFEDVNALSYVDIAQKIRADDIDILVDLNGYTEGSRTEILTQRPAPVTVQFLGYAGTMGSPLIDYLIADRFVIPENLHQYYDEKIVSMPDCYFPMDGTRAVAATPTRSDAGLPEEGVILCSLNQTYKITPTMFAIWMRVLQAVPGSVLWLQESNRWVANNLRREAQARGVDGSRLVFAPKLPLSEYLGRFKLADLFLDSLPYNAHTTALDALWMGVPVLTCPGEAMASRVAAGFLMAMGLPELIAPDLENYERMAVSLAAAPEQLAHLKATLHQRHCDAAVFDTSRFTRHLETAYRAMWERHQHGEAPAAIMVAAVALA